MTLGQEEADTVGNEDTLLERETLLLLTVNRGRSDETGGRIEGVRERACRARAYREHVKTRNVREKGRTGVERHKETERVSEPCHLGDQSSSRRTSLPPVILTT